MTADIPHGSVASHVWDTGGTVPYMGQSENVSQAVERVAAARFVAAQAGFLQRDAVRRAALAAAAEGLSVRQFAELVGLSKSQAARELRAANVPYAVAPATVPVLHSLEAVVRQRMSGSE